MTNGANHFNSPLLKREQVSTSIRYFLCAFCNTELITFFSKPMHKIKRRVVIIEHEAKLRDLLASLVDASTSYTTVNVYRECEEAIKNIKDDFPDIIAMNIEFPGMKGAEAITKIKKVLPQTNILIVAELLDDAKVFNALSAGADGYLLKSECVYNFISNLDDLATNGSPLSPAVARMIIESLQISRVSPLTSRETEVLRLITQGNSYVLIAKQLNISKETSKTHIRNIYKKLKVNSKSEVVRVALQEHYVSPAVIGDYQ